MPDAVTVPFGIRATISARSSLSGSIMQNVIMFKGQDATPDIIECEDVAAFVAGWCDHHYTLCFHDQIRIFSVVVRSMAQEPAPVAAIEGLTLDGSSGSAAYLADYISNMANFKASITGHARRGQFWSFPTTEGHTDGNFFTGAYNTLLHDKLVELRTNAIAQGYPMAVWTKSLAILTEVQTIGGTGAVRTLDSRKPGQGI